MKSLGKNSTTDKSGLTLLELLVVVAILVVLAGVVVVAFDDTGELVEARTVTFEMAEIKKALLRFHRDTGFLPGKGMSYLYQNDGDVRLRDLPEAAGGADSWLDCPANFWQLFKNPFDESHPLSTWDPVTRRGWNGPYFEAGGNGLVSVGSGLGSEGLGDPLSGVPLQGLFGIADPFVRESATSGLLGWTDLSGTRTYDIWGRPYFLFAAAEFSSQRGNSRTRIVSSGPNGKYESQRLADDDPRNDGDIGDDLVLYLAR